MRSPPKRASGLGKGRHQVRRFPLFVAVLIAAPFLGLVLAGMGFCFGMFGMIRTAFEVLRENS